MPSEQQWAQSLCLAAKQEVRLKEMSVEELGYGQKKGLVGWALTQEEFDPI
jgi:hypothetical protein